MPTCLSSLRSGRECHLLTTRIPSGFARGKISVYKKIYFRIYEKNIFAYGEIYFRAHGSFFPSAQRKILVRKAPKFPSARKFISLRKKKYFLAEGNFLLCARKFCAFCRAFLSLGEGGEFGRGRRLLREGRRGGFLGGIWKIGCGRNIFAVRLPMEGGCLRLT